MSDNKIRRSQRGNSFVLPLIILCIAVIFSALAAAVWQMATPEPEPLKPLELHPSVLNQFEPDKIAVPVVAAKVDIPIEAESKPDDAAPASSAPSKKDSDRVTSKYFNDAVFIGDSISVGIKLYEVMQNTDVFASVGISLENIFTNKAVKLDDGSKVTIFEALDDKPYKKAYIMLGANSLMSSHEELIKQYGRVIDEVRTRVGDDCIVYIQSVLPVYEELFHKKYPHNTVTNADIESFNVLLSELSEQKDVHYLDVASVIKDENGSLPPKYTSDGLHIGSELYIKWFDYLKTHAVSE